MQHKARSLPTTLVTAVAVAGIAVAFFSSGRGNSGEGAIDVADWVARWPSRFSVQGGKSEPTYVEAINIDRRGDAFTSIGGAPAWEQRAVETVIVDGRGTVIRLACGSRPCGDARPSVSFLSSAWLLAAYRRHAALGRAIPVSYGARQVVCLAAEQIGVAEAVLDPCFDLDTGAVLAQRHRLSGRFDGPSLDPGSIRISSGNPS